MRLRGVSPGINKFLIIAVISLIVSFVTSHCARGKEAGKPPSPPPPIEYQVGYISTENPYLDRYIRMNIAVAPSSTVEELNELMRYFADDKYADFDKVRIDIYDNLEVAEDVSGDPAHLLAKLEMTKPNFRKMEVYDIVREEERGQSDILMDEEKVVYLGPKSTTMFGSVAQANELLKVMEEYPNRAIYTLIWLQPQKSKLTYSVRQRMLVRKIEGISEEIWQGMTLERIERAAKGSGFGGKKTPGITYTLKPYQLE